MKPNYVPVNILEEFKDLEKAVALDELFKKEKWKLVKAYDDYSKEIGYQLYFGEGIQVDNNYEYGFPYLLNREETFKELERFVNYRLEKDNLNHKCRYYVYDFLIGQNILTIDVYDKRFRIDGFNIHGQCYSLNEEWKKITPAIINRAYRREQNANGYVIDSYILKHFSDDNNSYYANRNEKSLLYKSNNYDDCILFLVKYGKEKLNWTENENFEYYKKHLNDQSKTLDSFSAIEVSQNDIEMEMDI